MEFNIEIVLQPIIDSRTNEVVMAEALARPVGSNVAELLRQIKEEGAMSEFDKYMTEEVGKIDIGTPISVNWSKGIICEDIDIIKDHVIVEFTETMDFNSAEYRRIKKALEEKGVPIMLDDYSTGNTSVSLGGEFDSIKFPRELVCGDYQNLRSAVRDMSKFGVQQIVFEGVETAEDLVKVCTTNFGGAKRIQGYYIAKPMPITKFVAWRKSWTEYVNTVQVIA